MTIEHRSPIRHGLLPEGYDVLSVDPKLFFKVESDGGVVITGEPAKTFFNFQVTGGGTISGGIKMDGTNPVIFGDYGHNYRKYPLRWVPLDRITYLADPEDRRNKPAIHPWKTKLENKQDTEDYVSRSSYDRLKKENEALLAKLARVETQVTQVREQATKEIQLLREEFHKKVKVRSVHLESTVTRTNQVEGHKTEHWEIGDRKYLVIAETPSGLGSGSWVEDITKALNRVSTGNEITVAVVPSGAAVRVVEMIPVSEEAVDLDVGQF
jgi:hypothetical protein